MVKNSKKIKENRKSWYIEDDKDMPVPLESKGILVKFKTKQEEYAVTQTAISIELNSDKEKLNTILYHLLNSEEIRNDLPDFEFLVNGELLVCKLDELLRTEKISVELVNEIEYFEGSPAPKPHDSLNHDDWVSSVHCSRNWILSGCYDKSVHVWEINSNCEEQNIIHKMSLDAHKASVSAVRWLDDEKQFVSCSMDQKAIVWEVTDTKNFQVKRLYDCRGHSSNVCCIDVSTPTIFATGSWDNNIKIWDINKPSEYRGVSEDEPESKRIKLERTKTPVVTLAGHHKSISSVCWVDESKILSSSWDHTICCWDVIKKQMVTSLNSNMAFICMAYIKERQLALGSCTDRHIKLFDLRTDSKSKSIAVGIFSARKKWVSSISVSPTNENLFACGINNNESNIWDLRSCKAPLLVLQGHTDKVLTIDWSNPKYIATGSADCTVKVFSY